MFRNGIQVMRADRRGTVYRKFLYTLCQTQLFPPSICFLCSLDWGSLFIQLCLDISKNKSWILQRRFHCFLFELSQTIAQGRISHALPCKIQNPPRFCANHAHIRQHFSTFFLHSVNSKGAKTAPAIRAPRPQLAGISPASACYSSTDSRAEQEETRSIHDSLSSRGHDS